MRRYEKSGRSYFCPAYPMAPQRFVGHFGRSAVFVSASWRFPGNFGRPAVPSPPVFVMSPPVFVIARFFPRFADWVVRATFLVGIASPCEGLRKEEEEKRSEAIRPTAMTSPLPRTSVRLRTLFLQGLAVKWCATCNWVVGNRGHAGASDRPLDSVPVLFSHALWLWGEPTTFRIPSSFGTTRTRTSRS